MTSRVRRNNNDSTVADGSSGMTVHFRHIASTYRRNLIRQIDTLGYRKRTLFDGTFLIDILDLVAEILLRADEPDEAILDCQVHLCSFLDLFLYYTGRDDIQRFATAQGG